MICPFQWTASDHKCCVFLWTAEFKTQLEPVHTNTHTYAPARTLTQLQSHWTLAQIRRSHTSTHTHLSGEANLPEQTWVKEIMRLWWLCLNRFAPPWHHLWPRHDPYTLLWFSGNLHFWLAELTVENWLDCFEDWFGYCFKANIEKKVELSRGNSYLAAFGSIESTS